MRPRYDRPIFKVINAAIVIAVLAFLVWLAAHAPAGLGLLLCIPLFAWFASRGLVHGGEGLLSWVSKLPFHKWQGAYYQFNNVQIRVYQHHDTLLFVAEDVLSATGVARRPAAYIGVHSDELLAIPGTKHLGFGMHQVERLANDNPGTDAGSFLLWAQREVVGPWEKKRERARLGG